MIRRLGILLALLVIGEAGPIPPLPPGRAIAEAKTYARSPKDASISSGKTMVRLTAAVVVAPPAPVITNLLLTFDPISNYGATYLLRYEGAKRGVINMGTHTSVVITNVNISGDWKIEAYSVAAGVTGRAPSTLLVPGINRIGIWQSNAVPVVTWLGVTNRVFHLLSSSNSSGPWTELTNRVGTNTYEYYRPPGPGFYRWRN